MPIGHPNGDGKYRRGFRSLDSEEESVKPWAWAVRDRPGGGRRVQTGGGPAAEPEFSHASLCQ